MPVIIPHTTAEFTTVELIDIFTMVREGWDQLRSLQFLQHADILRYTTGAVGTPYKHIKPTETIVAGLTNLEVLVQDITKQESEKLGFRLEETAEGNKVFMFYGLFTLGLSAGILLTDRIRWPQTTGQIYKILRVDNAEEEDVSVAWSSRTDK